MASKLENAPWPVTKDEPTDYVQYSGTPVEMIENLEEIEDEDEEHETIRDIWSDYLSKKDLFLDEEGY